MQLTRGKVFALGGVVLIALVPLGLVGREWFHYVSSLRKARAAWRNSRPGVPGSFDFVTCGISLNMSEKQVDAILSEWTGWTGMNVEERRSGAMRKWDGYVKIYTRVYEPTWRSRLFGKEETLVRERLWVFFDSSGCAKKALYDLSVGASNDTLMIDLENETIAQE